MMDSFENGLIEETDMGNATDCKQESYIAYVILSSDMIFVNLFTQPAFLRPKIYPKKRANRDSGKFTQIFHILSNDCGNIKMQPKK